MDLSYLRGYPPELLQPVHELIKAGRLAQWVAERHTEASARELAACPAVLGYLLQQAGQRRGGGGAETEIVLR
jgi:hypothetical protein